MAQAKVQIRSEKSKWRGPHRLKDAVSFFCAGTKKPPRRTVFILPQPRISARIGLRLGCHFGGLGSAAGDLGGQRLLLGLEAAGADGHLDAADPACLKVGELLALGGDVRVAAGVGTV